MNERREILRRELGLFESAAERTGGGGVDAGDEFAARVAEEFLRRRQLRNAWAEQALGAMTGARPMLRRERSWPRWAALGLAAAYAGVIVQTRSAWILLAGGFVGLVGLTELADRRWKRRALVVEEGACPWCEYPLREVPDGIAPEVVGVRVGPRRCPECGVPWPRVPGVNG